MNYRRTRSRTVFGLESLEIRTAPSHVSALAHVVHQVHVARPAAHVEKLPETHRTESNTSIDQSKDAASGTTDTSSTSTDPSSPDPKTDH
jgi:hypothetical protein